MPTFETVWKRIEAHAGEQFVQIRGGVFTYEVNGGHVRFNRTDHQFPRSHFEEAYGTVPLETRSASNTCAGHRICSQS